MIRAADDYDAIRARLAEIGGRRDVAALESLKIDIAWTKTPECFIYYPVSLKALALFACHGFIGDVVDGYPFSFQNPLQFKIDVTGAENLIFEERPAP